MDSLQDSNEKLKQNSVASENNYKKKLEKMNASVDNFEESFQPLLNKIQDSDLDHTDFMKFSLEKFSQIII